jgi:hypothetical protein
MMAIVGSAPEAAACSASINLDSEAAVSRWRVPIVAISQTLTVSCYPVLQRHEYGVHQGERMLKAGFVVLLLGVDRGSGST